MQSKQNLELKHFCENFQEVRKALLHLGASKDTVKKQRDYFFHLPQQKHTQKARIKLRVEGKKMFLVYYERPDFVAGTDVSSDIALLEANKDTLRFLEKALGVSAVVEKRREVWRKQTRPYFQSTKMRLHHFSEKSYKDLTLILFSRISDCIVMHNIRQSKRWW
jgi:adenylate cyclase class IV